MEHTQLAARLLKEVAAARTAVASSYSRLWRSEPPASSEPGAPDRRAEPEPDPDTESAPDQHRSKDVDV